MNQKIEKLRNELTDVTSNLGLFSKHLSEFGTVSFAKTSEWSKHDMTTKMYSKNSQPNSLPDRIYIQRESLLTELFKISHVRTIRNIFISIMIILALQVIVNDLMEKGQ